jgi:regulator of sirC expression with transglutaminase-like and TPR domain
LQIIEQLLERRRSGSLYALKAEILHKMGQRQAALEADEAAIAAGAVGANVWLTKGLIHYELKQYAEAKQALSRYLQLRPRAHDAESIRVIVESL